MKITITKRQEYVNDKPGEPCFVIREKNGWVLVLNEDQLITLRDELNKLKL